MSSTSETRMTTRKKRESRVEGTRTTPPLLMLMAGRTMITAPGLKMALMMMAKRAVRRRVV